MSELSTLNNADSLDALYPRTDITYQNGRITQLDVFIPEVLPGQVVVGIDLNAFSLSHPLMGEVVLEQNTEEDDFDGCLVGQFSRDTDVLCLDSEYDFENVENILRIRQHVGRIGANAIVVGFSTFNIDQVIQEAHMSVYRDQEESADIEEYVERLIEGYGSN